MSKRYRALVGLRYPGSPEALTIARAEPIDSDAYGAIHWLRSEIGEDVPAYVIAGSSWLVEQGKVEEYHVDDAPEKPKLKPVAS